MVDMLSAPKLDRQLSTVRRHDRSSVVPWYLVLAQAATERLKEHEDRRSNKHIFGDIPCLANRGTSIPKFAFLDTLLLDIPIFLKRSGS